MTAPLSIYFVLGESSGDGLGADLLPVLKARAEDSGREIAPLGLAGPRLTAQGVSSLFDIEDIAVMGISAVLARMPTIIKRVRQTVQHIVEAEPDLVLLIDSPDFTHAVAKRVRKQLPSVPIVKYVCPSVWAWRSGRAAKMREFCDHVLALLPFEPQVMDELGGPPTTYVGHPLAQQIETAKAPLDLTQPAQLLVLPGSRSSEIKRLLPLFGETLMLLRNAGVTFEVLLPAVPHVRSLIEEGTKNWAVPVRIIDSSDNERTFGAVHAALAASGTVSLELALHRVPMTLAYKLDPLARQAMPFMKTWSVALPNLIAGWPLVPEDLNDLVIPQRMARTLGRLLTDTPERRAQLEGFSKVSAALATDTPSADIATDVIFGLLGLEEPR